MLDFSDAMVQKTWQIMEHHATSEGLDKTRLRPILQQAGIIHADGRVLLDGIGDQLKHRLSTFDEDTARKRICEAITGEQNRLASIRRRGGTNNGA